jgi:16S rRNA (guanine(1405)-N(7))-methyltransferase
VPYRAVDLDRRLVALVARFLQHRGQAGGATAIDLLGEEPLPAADVVLAFKLLPTLERQSKGAAARLLDRLDARALVLSFPTRSLGRKAKGMEENYARFAEELLAARGATWRTLATREELFFLVTALRPRRQGR